MQRKLASLITAATCAILALTAVTYVQAQAAKPDGTWTWSMQGRQGGTARVTTLKLKVDGDKLTGTVSSPGRQGGASNDTAITDGKIKGDEISFSVTREFNNNKMVSKYTGKISGDTIKGKIETERNGQTNSRDWEAKRSTEKK